MKLEKDAVTIMGFAGIFILLILIFVPPLMRFLFNDDVSNLDSQAVAERLSCEKIEKLDTYDITTTIDTVYKDKEINKITFNYNVVFTKAGVSDSEVYIENFEMLKQITNAEVNKDINNYTVVFDYTKYKFSNNSFLSKYSSSMSEQKIFYSNNGYKCNVLK